MECPGLPVVHSYHKGALSFFNEPGYVDTVTSGDPDSGCSDGDEEVKLSESHGKLSFLFLCFHFHMDL